MNIDSILDDEDLTTFQRIIRSEAAGAFLRKAITSIGAILVSRGFLDAGTLDESAINWIMGAVMLGGSWVLSKLSRSRLKKKAAQAAVVETKAVAIDIVQQSTMPVTAGVIAQQISDTQIITKDTKEIK